MSNKTKLKEQGETVTIDWRKVPSKTEIAAILERKRANIRAAKFLAEAERKKLPFWDW